VFGAVKVVFPASAGVEDNALVQPLFCGTGGPRGRDEADAIGKKGDAECRARVEVLADEEVAVIEGGGCKGYNDLEVLVGRKRGREYDSFTSLSFGCGSGIVIFSRG
jgi:hypothetical protein